MRLPRAAQPLTIMAALARSGLCDQYVCYENGAEWSFAGGRLAELRLGHTEVARHGIAAPVAGFLSALSVTEWRAYGWAAFELSHAVAGQPAPDDLLHLVIPEVEVRVMPEHVLLRAAGRTGLTELATVVDLVDVAPELPDAERVPVDLDDGGPYRERVATAVRAIRAGELDKVIVSRAVAVPGPVDLVASYVAGRLTNTPARSFLLRLGRMHAAGFSPETVARVAGGLVSTQPLAGTRARCGFAPEDARLRDELLNDPKEVYEHAISVRTAQEELAEVCGGTARIGEFMAVRERGSVQHLASRVTGRLAPGLGAWDAFATLFPAITASGIPKPAACRLIRELEAEPRGLYAGAVLSCDHNADLDAALVLRSIYQQDGRTWLRAGAGVVAQSTPDREHEETCEKLRSVASCLVPPGVAVAATGAGLGRGTN
jgi:salicylate synthetase